MNLRIFKLEEQAKGSFNGGEIKENKPLGFPQDGGGLKPYSNIFYWANAVASVESEIGLHPHRGFEIMSIILEGEIAHYDTYADKWISLKAGDVQLIRAGRGISHAELMKKNSRMFQVWFDPGLQNTLGKEPVYRDYKADHFKIINDKSYTVKIIKDSNGPITMDAEGVGIKEYKLKKGEHIFAPDKNTIYSLYCLEGNMQLNGHDFEKDSFAIASEQELLKVESGDEGRIFVIESPAKTSYKTYYELSGW